MVGVAVRLLYFRFPAPAGNRIQTDRSSVQVNQSLQGISCTWLLLNQFSSLHKLYAPYHTALLTCRYVTVCGSPRPPPPVIKMATPYYRNLRYITYVHIHTHTHTHTYIYIYIYIYTFDTKEQGLAIRPTNDVAPMFKQPSLLARMAEIRVTICKLQWRLVP